MNSIDIVLLIPILWFAYKGLNKGLIFEIASLIGLIAGIYIAVNFSWFIGNLIQKNVVLEDNTCALVAFAITFVGVMVGVRIVAKAIEKIINAAMLGFVNKIAGAAFGALKIAFILSVILYFYHRIDPRMTVIPFDTRENSILYRPVQGMAPFIIPKLEAEKDKYNLQIKKKREEEGDDPATSQGGE